MEERKNIFVVIDFYVRIRLIKQAIFIQRDFNTYVCFFIFNEGN